MIQAARALWRLLRSASPAALTAVILSMFLAGLTEGLGLMLLLPLLESLQPGRAPGTAPGWAALQPWADTPSLASLLLTFLALMALRSGIILLRDRLSHHLQHQVVDLLRERVYEALLAVEWRWLARSTRSEQANLLLTEVQRVGFGLHQSLSLMTNVASMFAYLVGAFVLSWPLATVVVTAGVLALGLQSGQRRQAVRLGHHLSHASRGLHSNVQDSLAGIRLAKMHGTEARHLAEFRQVTEELRQRQTAFLRLGSQQRAAFQIGSAALLAGGLYLSLTWWHTPMPVLLTQIALFARLSPRMQQAQDQLQQALHALPAYLRTEALLATCRAHAEPAAPDASDVAPWQVCQHIALRAVQVEHPDRAQPILNQIDLVLPAHTTTAVIGESGSGKSTLADVLAGLLEPDSGELLLDGQAVLGSQRRRWRQQVAYVSQDAFFFHGSIRQNLLRARPDADEGALQAALRQAAAEFVMRLPQGLDTQVGDGGQQLSGGERQRLALARALLQSPTLLILDEATSALDADNEARIRAALERLHGDITVLLIGHRLSTLAHADQVIVMSQGHIAERGTWSTLSTTPKSA